MIMKEFTPGSVGHTLLRMCGVWRDHIEIHALDGTPMTYDPHGGTPGPAPYDNLVYVDFDGELYRQTNVSVAGRQAHVRSFIAHLIDGVLHFDTLGPNDPIHIGVSGGEHTVIFCPKIMTEAWQRYNEPDWIYLPTPDVRMRATVLYRHGTAVRTLRANGVRVATRAGQRVAADPRGRDGDVHQARGITTVYIKDDGKNE